MEIFIYTLINKYGLFVAGLFIAFIAAIKTSTYQQIVKYFKNKNLNLFTEKDILCNKLTYWLEFKIDNINIVDTGRRVIFGDILKFQFETIQNKVFNIEQSPDFDSISGAQLYTRILECLHEVNLYYEQLSVEAGIPNVVIEKFNKWHTPSLEHMMKNIELVSKSKLYRNNRDKMQAIYSIYTAMLDITLMEAERTLSELNGELTGIKYKGVECKDFY